MKTNVTASPNFSPQLLDQALFLAYETRFFMVLTSAGRPYPIRISYPGDQKLHGQVTNGMKCNKYSSGVIVGLWHSTDAVANIGKSANTEPLHLNLYCLPSSLWIFTLKSLSIGKPNLINFPFVSNGKYLFFRCPNIQAHYNETVLWLSFGTLKIMNFPFGTNGKFIIFRCPNN